MKTSLRRALAGTAAAIALTASIAGAHDGQTHLINDAEDDATGFVVASTPLPSTETLDIVAGDLSYDHEAQATTVVVHLKDLTAEPPPAATGKTFYVNFAFDGTRFFLNATQEAVGDPVFRLGDFGGAQGARRGLADIAVTGAFDPEADTVTMTLPDAEFAKATNNPVVVPGDSWFDSIEVLAQRLISAGGTGATPTADTALADDSFLVPAPPVEEPTEGTTEQPAP